jgi:hypothetical protein
MNVQVQQQLKDVGDVASIATLVGTLAKFLPAIAALFTIVWTVMRIVDEWPRFRATVRGWFKGPGA